MYKNQNKYYNRINLSEGIDVAKSSYSKKCMICPYLSLIISLICKILSAMIAII